MLDTETLEKARSAGYSDEEIYGHLAQSDPRFDAARQHGYSLDDVASHFTPLAKSITAFDKARQNMKAVAPISESAMDRSDITSPMKPVNENIVPESMLPVAKETPSRGVFLRETPSVLGELKEGKPFSAAGIAYENTRRMLTPWLGPTESERTEKAIPFGKDEQGNPKFEYLPLGDRTRREGGLFTPFLKVEPMQHNENDSALVGAGKAAFNIAANLEGAILSPGGVAMGGLPASAGRVASGAFAVDMAASAKDQIQKGLESRDPFQQIEGLLGGVITLGMAAKGIQHAGTPTKQQVISHMDTVPDEVAHAATTLKDPEIASAAKAELGKRAQQLYVELKPAMQRLPGDIQTKVSDILDKQAEGKDLSIGEQATMAEVKSYAAKLSRQETNADFTGVTDKEGSTQPAAREEPIGTEGKSASPRIQSPTETPQTQVDKGTSSLFKQAQVEALAKADSPLTAEAIKQEPEVRSARDENAYFRDDTIISDESMVPKSSKIIGPALRVHGEEKPVAYGKEGQKHSDLVGDAQASLSDERLAKVMDDFASKKSDTGFEHVFHDEDGNVLNREDAARRALAIGQITKAQFDKAMARTGEGNRGLHSEDLIEAKKDAARTQKLIDSEVSTLHASEDAAEMMDNLESIEDEAVRQGIAKQYGIDPNGKDANDLNMEIAEKAMEVKEAGASPIKGEVPAEFPQEEAPAGLPKEQLPGGGTMTKRVGMSEGPGAAAETEPLSTTSQINQLREAIKSVTDSPSLSIAERLKQSVDVAVKLENTKDSLKGALLKAKSISQTIWDSVTKLPDWTNYDKAVGDWSGAINKSDFESRAARKEFIKRIPDPVRREAITNWIQAEGDEAVLSERASRSDGKAKKGYEAALKLTEEEKVAAMNVSQYLDSMLQQGIEAGVFKNGGIENYVTQLWKRPNPITDKLVSDIQFSKVPVTLKFAKQRIFGSYFEGEQAGFKPLTKDIADLISIYDNAVNKTIAARAFVKNLHEGFAKDGRPLVEISGYGQEVPKEGPNEATLIKPHAKTEETGDYIELDHPALRDWKWAGTNAEGKPILFQGNLLVHPEVFGKLKNTLGSSVLRQNEFARGMLSTQAFLKQTKLSISLFHAVQEGVHAVFHRINPFAPEKLNFDDPLQKELVDHGLQVADYRPMQEFSEGLSGKGGLAERIPFAGKYLQAYNEWLFQDYIPGLKMSMAKHALDRNLQRYSKQLESGELNRDQIVAMTARQANAAFGELNYKMMARNPTFQDVIRATTLAPDFLEARGRFVAQAFTRYGGEQRAALLLMGATMFIGSRVLNQIFDGDMHWEKPFSVVKDGKEYGLRTIAGDVQHLFTDPRSFVYNRLSPISRAGVEALMGRDDRGIKRGVMEQLEDMASWLVPISMDKRSTETMTQKILGSAGVRQANYSSIQQANNLAKDWTKKNVKEKTIEMLSKDDKNYSLTVMLQNGNDEGAKKLIDEMKKAGDKGISIKKRLLGPLTKNAATEAQFVNSLNPQQRKLYDQSRQARGALYQKYLELGGSMPTTRKR